MSQPPNVSAPEYRPEPPRALDDQERAGLLALADVLIPDSPAGPRPSRIPAFERWLDRALAARRDAFDAVTALARELAGQSPERVLSEARRRSDAHDEAFGQLSAVVAGAYLMVPEVRRAIGYPGQAQRPPRFDESAEQIMDGILEAVVERGPVFRAAPAGPSTQAGR